MKYHELIKKLGVKRLKDARNADCVNLGLLFLFRCFYLGEISDSQLSVLWILLGYTLQLPCFC